MIDTDADHALPQGFARISVVVDILEKSMFGNLPRTEAVAKIKSLRTKDERQNPPGRQKWKQISAASASVGWEPQRLDAKEAIRAAGLSGKLKIFALIPKRSNLLRVAPSLLSTIICPRGGLPDRVGQLNLAGLEPNQTDEARSLKDALLLVDSKEFELWRALERRKGKWSSQKGRKAPKRGRPSRQSPQLRDQIVALFRDGKWSGRDGVPALWRILRQETKGDTPSEDTLARLLKCMFTETGEFAFKITARRKRVKLTAKLITVRK